MARHLVLDLLFENSSSYRFNPYTSSVPEKNFACGGKNKTVNPSLARYGCLIYEHVSPTFESLFESVCTTPEKQEQTAFLPLLHSKLA